MGEVITKERRPGWLDVELRAARLLGAVLVWCPREGWKRVPEGRL